MEGKVVSKGGELPPEFSKWDKPFGLEQHYVGAAVITIGHIGGLYYLFYLWPLGIVSRWTMLFAIFYVYVGAVGTTVGAHRYWTHKSFKASLPFRILLMLMQTTALEFPLFKWCRDHRVHHKYTDTDADPHDAKKGFWFSHMTWLMTRKHPQVWEKLGLVYVDDLVSDPVVRFQSKYYMELLVITLFIIPMSVMRYFFPGMSLFHMFCVENARFIMLTHIASAVNSFAHIFGNKPYDKDISASDNKVVSLLAAGEGWHNYHHTFPWDYRAAEFGYKLNISTMFIDFFAKIGWAWDLKTVSPRLLSDRINRTGDKSHPLHVESKESTEEEVEEALPAWGWGDDDVKKEDIIITETLFARRCKT